MGDCNLTLTYNCPKNCKYSYSTWCPTCEINSPRRRSRSETSEPKTECRRKCKEMKTFTPRKYPRSQEYENMELEYDVKDSWCQTKDSWCETKDSRFECCRIRSNLCELPTSYISNNCQSVTSKLSSDTSDFVVKSKPLFADLNHISSIQKDQKPVMMENKVSSNKMELIRPYFRSDQKVTPPKNSFSAKNKTSSPFFYKNEICRDNQNCDDYKNCREYCTLVDLKLHNIQDRSLCYDTTTYFNTKEKDSLNIQEKYNNEVEYLREKLLSLKNSSYTFEKPSVGKTFIDIMKEKYGDDSNSQVIITKPIDLKPKRSKEKRILSPPVVKPKTKITLKTRTNSGKMGSAKMRKSKAKVMNSNVPSVATESGTVNTADYLFAKETLKKLQQNDSLKESFDKENMSYIHIRDVLKKCIQKNSKGIEKDPICTESEKHNEVKPDKEIQKKKKQLQKQNIKPTQVLKQSGSSICSESENNLIECSSDDSEPEIFDVEPDGTSEQSTGDSDDKKEDIEENIVICLNESGSGDADLSWPIRISLFPHIPPYISFTSHDSEIPIKFPHGGKFFKWKLTTITPILVRQTLTNSGFCLVRSEFSRESNQWLGTWGKHMKSPMFKTLKDTQKINHFPGTFQLGRKDRLWRNFQRLINKFGHKEFGFIPHSYVLPQELKLLKQNWEFKNGSGGEMWIIKPPASARGVGIKVINKWSQLPKKMSLVVQKYIPNPYLINGSKFDLRLYVLVTSFHPLRIYLYPDGLARFASAKYSDDSKDLKDRYRHLTNYSINKLSEQYTANEDANACQGHKWTLSKLMEYLQDRGVNSKILWKNLQQLVIKTMISAESPITQLCEENMNSIYNCYELFGVDVLLDEDLKPWLLEVNISPSLHSSSPLDAHVKGPMVQTLFDMAQFHLPSKISQLAHSTPAYYNPKLYTTALSKQERLKHTSFEQYETRSDYLSEILTQLTGDDVRHLTRAEDEYTVKGRFERIFPTGNTHKYLEFMEPRYYNRLFDAWETKYSGRRQEGIDLLKLLCTKKLHLKTAPPSKLKKNSLSMIPGDLKLQPSKEVQNRPLEEILRTASITNDIIVSAN